MPMHVTAATAASLMERRTASNAEPAPTGCAPIAVSALADVILMVSTASDPTLLTPASASVRDIVRWAVACIPAAATANSANVSKGRSMHLAVRAVLTHCRSLAYGPQQRSIHHTMIIRLRLTCLALRPSTPKPVCEHLNVSPSFATTARSRSARRLAPCQSHGSPHRRGIRSLAIRYN